MANAKSAAKAGKEKNDQPGANVSGAQGDITDQTAAGQSGGNDSDLNVKSTPGLEVTSKQDGFWRGDLKWSSNPTVVKLCDLSDHQIDQIKGEPMLTVVDVDVPQEQEGE